LSIKYQESAVRRPVESNKKKFHLKINT